MEEEDFFEEVVDLEVPLAAVLLPLVLFFEADVLLFEEDADDFVVDVAAFDLDVPDFEEEADDLDVDVSFPVDLADVSALEFFLEEAAVLLSFWEEVFVDVDFLEDAADVLDDVFFVVVSTASFFLEFLEEVVSALDLDVVAVVFFDFAGVVAVVFVCCLVVVSVAVTFWLFFVVEDVVCLGVEV